MLFADLLHQPVKHPAAFQGCRLFSGSHLFDPNIHALIQQVFDRPDLLSLRYVHELRQYAESAIPKSVMKGFKQYLWENMP